MKINAWLESVNWSASDLARKLKVSRSCVCRWCADPKSSTYRRPNTDNILKIQKLTENLVRLEDWA
jgi:hypothetical protein